MTKQSVQTSLNNLEGDRSELSQIPNRISSCKRIVLCSGPVSLHTHRVAALHLAVVSNRGVLTVDNSGDVRLLSINSDVVGHVHGHSHRVDEIVLSGIHPAPTGLQSLFINHRLFHLSSASMCCLLSWVLPATAIYSQLQTNKVEFG